MPGILVIVFFLFTLFLFVLITYFLTEKKNKSAIQKLQENNVKLEIDKKSLDTLVTQLSEIKNEQAQQINKERQDLTKMQEELGAYRADKANLLERLNNDQIKLKELQKTFQLEFENIANKLLKSNSNQFAEANQKSMSQIVNPLKEKILAFEKRVNDVYTEETKQRSELKNQMSVLMDLNKTISEDAQNLTNALKGDTKAQGNWGELILERVLENSGLVKDQEYFVQVSTSNDEGKRIQPDVVVKLPDNKHIIIDSKVSLVAYEKFTSCTNFEDQEKYIKEHILSIKSHIKGLSDKKYERSKDINTLDFVLLFMPLEGAFSLALQKDSSLYALAWKHNIVLVSPTTLLATLKTVASIWKQEKQTKNAIEIADRAGALYDKFIGFLNDMEQIDKGLSNAKKSYDEAKSKLIDGKGNLVSRVQNLKKLGAKAKDSKVLPGSFNKIENENV